MTHEFVRAGNLVVNLDKIVSVDLPPDGGDKLTIQMTTGAPLTVETKNAEELIGELGLQKRKPSKKSA